MRQPENQDQLPSPRPLKRLLAYFVSMALVALAMLLATVLHPWLGDQVTIIFFAAVMLAAWHGGLGPALLATGVATVASTLGFPNPAIVDWDDALRMIVFLMVALLISSLTSLRRRAEANLRRSHDELELRVQRRTAELRASNDKLRESEERFRLLVEGVSDYAIIMLDSGGDVVSWNAGAQRILGWEQEQIVGRPCSLFFPEGLGAHEHCQRQLAQAAGAGRHEDEGWRVRRDGSRFLAEVFTTALRAEDGRLRGYAQVARDVSQLRELERQVLEISESEHRRIGHDLHDGLGQELTGLAFLSQNLAERLAVAKRAEATEAERLAVLTARAIEQTRELAHGFSPVELDPEGLIMALTSLAERVNDLSPMQCEIECHPDALVSDDAAALQLYRIAQEAINNAVRHSRGNRIKIALKRRDSAIILTVNDDGCGVSPTVLTGSGGGMGINLMRYRARTIRGMVEIGSSGGGGTEVICTWPIVASNNGIPNYGKDASSGKNQQVGVSNPSGG